MNPVIVIPSYWDRSARPGPLGERGVYDYTTPIDKPLPELEVCLSSLEHVSGVLRVIVLVVAPQDCEEAARARVNSICRAHADLNPLVIGAREASHVERAVSRMAHHVAGETVSLRGYGAIRNMGLAVAAILGHDVVVFLDDDEVALGEDYLTKAVWGLGSLTRQNLQVLVKSGFFIDELGSPYAEPSGAWSEKYWSKAADFNRVMERAQTSASRITRSNHLCGGCCALHAAAFSKAPFDPYITRGEDLDYVLNVRAMGMDVWFDNEWCVQSQPPEEMAGAPSLFMQDVHRWLYEYRKLDAMNARPAHDYARVAHALSRPVALVWGAPSRVPYCAAPIPHGARSSRLSSHPRPGALRRRQVRALGQLPVPLVCHGVAHHRRRPLGGPRDRVRYSADGRGRAPRRARGPCGGVRARPVCGHGGLPRAGG